MAEVLSDAQIKTQFKQARAATRMLMRQPSWPVHAAYDDEIDHIIIGLRGGAIMAIPRSAIKELAKASSKQLQEVELWADGLHWEELDIDISIPGLLEEVMGATFFSSVAGRIGGRSKSKAKADAARANGAKGGRPRKRKTA
jgi:hypothetical protein